VHLDINVLSGAAIFALNCLVVTGQHQLEKRARITYLASFDQGS
jgi:hypothetical protein